MRPCAPQFERLERKRPLSAGTFAPQISLLNRVTVVEDTATPVRVRVFDRDSGVLHVSVRVSSGFVSVKAAPGVTVDAPENRLVFIDGPRSAVNKTLERVVFKPAMDSTDPATITVTASDGANRSTRGGTIRVVPVNDAPTVACSGRLFAAHGSIDLGPQPISDPDSPRLSVSLKSDNGVVRILHPAARNLGNEARLSGSMETINGIVGGLGKVVLEPAADRNTRLTITASDGLRTTTRVVLVSHRENLPHIATDAVDARIRGRDPVTAKPVFSVMDHATATYVRNQAAWTHDLDLTCISPWNSAGGSWYAGTLVSPRHVVYATHFQIPVGATMRFVSRENEVVERTLVGAMSLRFSGQSAFPDITVGVLDSDVPPTIGFAAILPDDWAKYLPDGRQQIPCLALDQEEKALVTSLWWLHDEASCFEPKDATQRSFFERLVVGDSGNPGFMIVDDRLVLMTVWTYGSGGFGTFVTGQRAAIDQVMAELGGGYRLTTIDLGRLGTL